MGAGPVSAKRPNGLPEPLKLICISDTHGRHAELNLPPGDVLLHAGDFTRHGKPAEIRDFNAWLDRQPHAHKLVIAGNHDFLFETDAPAARALLTAGHYLEDSGIEIAGVKFWGSPVSPRFFDWAFNRSRGEEIAAHWRRIPVDTQVLLTHGPPQGVCDRIWLGRHVGCEALAQALTQRIQPLLHVCGHIHEAAGHARLGATEVLNASSLDRQYRPTQPIWCVELNAGRVMGIDQA